MADTTLANFRTKIRAVLADTSTTYSDTDIDYALRATLKEYDTLRPRLKTGTITGNGTDTIDLSAITGLVKVFKAESGEVFNFRRDDKPYLLIYFDLADGVTEDIEYQIIHTIKDLDSATATSIVTVDEMGISYLAAAYCLLERARARSETVNIQPEQTKLLLDLAGKYMQKGRALILPETSTAKMPVWELDR